jgi:hypothetical protein
MAVLLLQAALIGKPNLKIASLSGNATTTRLSVQPNWHAGNFGLTEMILIE